MNATQMRFVPVPVEPAPTPTPEAVSTASAAATPADAPLRIEIGPGAALLIDSQTYEANRDRAEWLVRWARKVFE